VVEMKNAARRDSAVRKSGLRCPACLLVEDFTMKTLLARSLVARASLSASIHLPGRSWRACRGQLEVLAK
jgi:hypothetical protein